MKFYSLTRSSLITLMIAIPGALLGRFLEIPLIISCVIVNMTVLWIIYETNFLVGFLKLGNKTEAT